jgi:hypothetical protein
MSTPYRCEGFSVAPWTASTEAYGTPVSVQNVQGVSVEPQHDTDEQKILGAVEETLSVLTSLDITVSFGGIDWASMAVMSGTADSSSGGATHHNNDDGGDDMPYFGAWMKFPLKGGGEAHVGFPKCQLQSRIPLDLGEQNQLLVSEIDVKAMRLRLADGTTLSIRYYREYAAATALPTNFNTAFGIS